MTYEEIVTTASDGLFQSRLTACAVQEAQVNPADPLSAAILANANEALGMTYLVASAPVAGDLAEDPVLLSAVQYAWPLYGAAKFPAG